MKPELIITMAATLLMAWLVIDWQSGYQYKPFTLYLRDEVRHTQAAWNEWMAR